MKPSLNLTPGDVENAIAEMGALALPLRFQHIEELSALPLWPDHKDPFDRMLIAQALAEGAAIISSDARFEQYRRLKLIWH